MGGDAGIILLSVALPGVVPSRLHYVGYSWMLGVCLFSKTDSTQGFILLGISNSPLHIFVYPLEGEERRK